jgi:anaphase-promoting complex subunit 3
MSVAIDSIKVYINQFIHNFDYVDAVFLAERLYAEVKNDESTYLLARTYYLSGDVNKSYWLLRNSSIEHVPAAKLLLAKCCFDTDKLHEAESMLVGNFSSISTLALDDFVNDHGDQAAFALQLLAKVCEKSDRHQKASECYRKSLKLNPFLWSSFEALCRLGERVDTSIFCSSSIKSNPSISEITQPHICVTPYAEQIKDIQSENQAIDNSMNTSTNQTIKERQQQRSSQAPAIVMKLTDSILNVGSTNIPGIVTSTPIGLIADQLQDNDKYTPPTIKPPDYIPSLRNPPLAPKRQNTRNVQQYGFDDTTASGSTATLLSRHELASTSLSDTRKTIGTRKENKSIRATTKRTTRLTKTTARPPCTDMSITTPTAPIESPNKMTTRSQVRSNNTSLNCSMDTELINKRDRQKKNQSNHHQRTPEIIENIINVFKLLGQGLQHLSQFECRQAIEIFESISLKHLDTPWVLSHLANCYYHLHDYQKSSLIYRELRTKFPYHIDGLEYYSTVLWHLKDDIALATLAHELTETDRKHSASWCASGNCLSLNHEYDKAIQAFKRAIQLAPESDYAYTLLGNEYSLIDELERAMACFRKAIQLNLRSYKAWNGLAMVYLKQEKFSTAELHFTRATTIFRTNPDLICHLAVAQHKCNRSESALTLLNDALKIDSKNALCKFHKAGLLLHLERYQEALIELEELRQIAPKESLVYYLLSKVHRHLKNFHYSYMYMSWSMDLDPKGANNQLKENADKFYSKDEDLLLGMEDMASSVTEDDNSQMQSQSSLQDIQPMDSSEEIL